MAGFMRMMCCVWSDALFVEAATTKGPAAAAGVVGRAIAIAGAVERAAIGRGLKPVPAAHVREREVAAGEEDECCVDRLLHGGSRFSRRRC